MLAWTKTYHKDNSNPTKTLVNVSAMFCEGYGNGFIGTVIKSPHKNLIGTEVKIDGRSKLLNPYVKPVGKNQTLPAVK